VILATDGDFNVGVTDGDELVALAREQADAGVFLTVLGFGQGNLQDATLERLADEADGHYAYVDDLAEARKVLVEELGSTLVTVAKDVKIQVAFDPAQVAAFRLVGYENRLLEHHEFEDDRVDAGEIGAGHGVTALYELAPVGVPLELPGVDTSDWIAPEAAPGGATLEVRLRWQAPEGGQSRLATFPALDRGAGLWETSDDFRFCAAVAAFGLLLRNSPARGTSTLELVEELATRGRGADPRGYRAGFLELVGRARDVICGSHLVEAAAEGR
jgi:Ca-activated chloride channel family protein